MNARIRKKSLARLRISKPYVAALTQPDCRGLVDACMQRTRAGGAVVVRSAGRSAVLLPARWLIAANSVLTLSGVGAAMGEAAAVLTDPITHHASMDRLFRRAFPNRNYDVALDELNDSLERVLQPLRDA